MNAAATFWFNALSCVFDQQCLFLLYDDKIKDGIKINRECSSSQILMEQILLQNNRFTMREKYCHLIYKIMRFKSKEATLLIIWSTLAMNLLYYLLTHTWLEGVHFIALLFTLPIAGWLVDVYLGRYKVIQWSMWIVWVGSMLATLSSVIAQLVDR